MRRIWQLAGACFVAGTLAACGGGSDGEANNSEDTTAISGGYTGCDALDTVPLGSVRTTLNFGPTGLTTLTKTVYAGTRSCNGSPAAVVQFPVIQFTDSGTKLVAGPNGGTYTARKAIATSNAADIAATVYGGVEYDIVDGELFIKDPNSTGDLYSVEVAQPASSDNELLIRFDGRLYLGVDTIGGDNYPVAIDYSSGWAPI